MSLESTFFTDFKKRHKKLWLSHISSNLSRNDIINLVSSKVTRVCEIMTCFTNDDIIDLLMTTRHIYFDTKMFVSG